MKRFETKTQNKLESTLTVNFGNTAKTAEQYRTAQFSVFHRTRA